MTRGTVSRSDLALLTSGADARTMPRELAAELCGFDYAPALQPQPPPKRKKIPRREGVSPSALLQEDELPPLAPRQRQLEFWHPACARYKSPEDRARERQPPDWVENARFDPDEMHFEGAPLAGQPLIRWSRLWPFLRQVLGRRHPGRRPDVPRLVRGIAEGRPLRRLPRVARRGWHPEVHVLVDRRLGLASFWDDYDWLLHRLTALRGSLGLSVLHLEREGDDLIFATGSGERRPYRMAGQPLVIALGDLGQYEGGAASAAWHALGRRLRRGGASPMALCPCPRNRWAPAMTRVWRMFCWERGAALSRRGQRADVITADDRAAHTAAQRNRLHALLRLLSPAVRIERGLLRDMRCLLPGHEADAGLEYDAFQSTYTYGQGFGFSIHAEKIKALRAELAGHVTPALLVEAVRLIFRHHLYCSRVFHPQEVLGLLDILPQSHQRALTEAGLIHPDSHAEARSHCQRLVAALWRGSYGTAHGPMLAYAGRALDRLQASALTAQEMRALWRLAHPGSRREYPAHVSPGDLLWMDDTPPDAPLRQAPVALCDGLVLRADRGVVLDVFQGRQDHIRVILEHPDGSRRMLDVPWDARNVVPATELRGSKAIELHSDHQSLRLARMTRPAWAARMWYDRDGLCAAAAVQGGLHKLRWGLPSRATDARGSLPPADDPRPSFERVNVGALAIEMHRRFQSIADQARVRFEVFHDLGRRFEGWTDRHLLDHIASELISNALKYTPADGRVAMHVRVVDSALMIEVRDTGIGIKDAHLDAIFEPGFRSETFAPGRSDGSGLGLLVVDRMTRRLGGRVLVVSNATGPGSTFRVVLPWPQSREEAVAALDKARNSAVRDTGRAPPVIATPADSSPRWIAESRPLWATSLFVDDHGLAAEFHIRSVPFVLRWIPPGRFLMGSPEDEPGRYDNEGPRHEVRITRGFWMGETPVTQAQWRAVVEAAGAQPGLVNRLLGKKTLDPTPSHFQGPAELPVESVSWEDSRLLCRLLDALVPGGPGFCLPTEAQWEYACRAGTQTALYTGEIEIRGENDAPALDPIAWYGGNSGNDLEVSNPEGSSSWPKKQYPHEKAATHCVKLKQANPWGLHDMLGNVWEWCADAWDEKAYANRVGGVKDPRTDSTDEGAYRVLRGGSWDYQARYCRAAIRVRYLPGFRWFILGLRLSAGQELGSAEPQERSDSGPERRSRARRAGGKEPA